MADTLVKYTPLDASDPRTNQPLQGDALSAFEEIFKKYPNNDGKKKAKEHFFASVKTEEDWTNINKALENYLGSEKVQNGYVKNASTWFNNWQDWVDYKERSRVKKNNTMDVLKNFAKEDRNDR